MSASEPNEPVVDETESPDHAISSSDRVGPTGPGQVGSHGVRDTSAEDASDQEHDDAPPEQRPGGPEESPEGIEPKSGYPSPDPRSQDKPFEP